MAHVILLPAFPLDSRLWEPVAIELARAGHEPEELDLPGLGSGPGLAGEPSLRQAAEFVRGRLRPGTVVGGVSMGGYVAMALLRLLQAEPDGPALGGLALCDTKSTADSEAGRASRLAMAQAVESDPACSPALLRAGLLDALLAPNPDAHVRSLVGQWLDDAPPRSIAYYQRAMASRPDSREALAAFDGPALVLWGDEDMLSPAAEQELTLAALASPTRAVIPGAGHLACLERPDEVAQALVGWLADIA